jgi:hypothetical protein
VDDHQGGKSLVVSEVNAEPLPWGPDNPHGKDPLVMLLVSCYWYMTLWVRLVGFGCSSKWQLQLSRAFLAAFFALSCEICEMLVWTAEIFFLRCLAI